ncbi:muskelin-like isoform X2 [Rhopilema esculentum]|uniref:muskelin-like isoform X2 n=1 Tax=Rhopilema esculentum TaxID=499914 RepID=UPI0031D70735
MRYCEWEEGQHHGCQRWASIIHCASVVKFFCKLQSKYLILKLTKPAIVTTITFGKYEKSHVCNLKKLKVYGGLNTEHMIEIMSGGLKNDSLKETFTLKHELEKKMFPCKFVKIVPLMAWGSNFNFSIWHVSLKGIDDPETIKPCLKWYKNYREREAIRLCLKHFRQKNYIDAFDSLQKRTKISLEHPMLTELHAYLVKDGRFEGTERIIEQAGADGLFDAFIAQQEYEPKWIPIIPLNEDGEESTHRPGMRGGHQMCIDAEGSVIYLLGGWDGIHDLSDFWAYHCNRGQWECLSLETASDGGPSARSCHKICLDTKRHTLYTLGRYLDSETRANADLKSDFYRYDLQTGHWERITEDTAKEGGPQLVFDHQMIFDPITDNIFVFGGRILTNSSLDDRSFEPQFSGLYSYNIPTNTWKKLRDDTNSREAGEMKSRIGHSMLFHTEERLLYIFAGQRGKEFLSDFFTYSVDTGEVRNILEKGESRQIPAAGFTQRSTIDSELNEIYVLSGLSKDKEKREETVRNSFWVHDIKRGKWFCVYQNENMGQHYWTKMQYVEPCPRFAHQLVYDSVNKTHYLFGGNPGKSSLPKMRLDDFWMLKLQRPNLDYLVRRCKFMIRKHRYRELTQQNKIKALSYLQTEVSELVDHTDTAERMEFESLASTLFSPKISSSDSSASSDDEDFESSVVSSSVHKHRVELFDRLTAYFPENMVQPKGNLVDLMTV